MDKIAPGRLFWQGAVCAAKTGVAHGTGLKVTAHEKISSTLTEKNRAIFRASRRGRPYLLFSMAMMVLPGYPQDTRSLPE